jgi:uncharacterized protein YbaP (TraB family)
MHEQMRGRGLVHRNGLHPVMKRFIGPLSCLLLALVAACASSPAPAPTKQQAPAAAEHPCGSQHTASRATPGLFLYDVERDGKCSWLLGTIHLGFGFDEVLTDAARQRFQMSREVITETDVTNADPARLMNAALLPAGQSLRTMLGEPTWSALVNKLGGMVPAPMLDRLEPWMPATMLGLTEIQEALKQERPEAGNHMMDAELMHIAEQRKLPLAFLETVDEQIAIFESIPQQEQIEELARALSEEQTDLGRTMVDAFASGNEQALTNALFDEEHIKEAPGFYEAVLFARNQRWLARLEQHFAQGRAFVAVGAGHLLGDKGIIHALQARGYRVTRLQH